MKETAKVCLCMRGIPRRAPLRSKTSGQSGEGRMTVPPGAFRGSLKYGMLREADRDGIRDDRDI